MRRDEDELDPEERLREIAAILSAGLRRLARPESTPPRSNVLEDVAPDSLSDHGGCGGESGGDMR